MTSVDRPFVDETRGFDTLNRLTSVANTNVGTGSYTYDANSNKLTESWTGVMSPWNFTTEKTGATYPSGYDAEDRFRNFIQTSKSKDVYLDRSDIENISNYKLNSTDSLRGYSNIHELTSVGATTQAFDTDGNLTDAHSGIQLGWDEAGMVKQTIVSATDTAGIEGTNDYGYDASKKRTWKKVTRNSAVVEHTVYIYAGPNCIAEYQSGAVATAPDQEYVYGQGIDALVMIVRNSGAQKLTVTRNQQWSVSALADNADGTVLERYTYDVFGKRTILAADGSTVRTTSSYDNPYGYTSRRHDEESGLMYFRARMLDPTTGEFASQDPLEYVDGMSLYRGYFVQVGVDPAGLQLQDSDLRPDNKWAYIGNSSSGEKIWRVSPPGICVIKITSSDGKYLGYRKVECPRIELPDGSILSWENLGNLRNVMDIINQLCKDAKRKRDPKDPFSNGPETDRNPFPGPMDLLGGVVNEAAQSIGKFKEEPCKSWMKITTDALMAARSGDCDKCGSIVSHSINSSAKKCRVSFPPNHAGLTLEFSFEHFQNGLARACRCACQKGDCDDGKHPTKPGQAMQSAPPG